MRAQVLPAIGRPELSQEEAEARASLLKALADPARLRILDIIRGRPDREACVCEFVDVLGLAQPTVSHHLKVLTDAGLLVRERRGTWAWFAIAPEAFAAAAALLDRTFD